MQFQRIAPNLFISNNSEFDVYNLEIVHGLLKTVDSNFSTALQKPPFSSRTCRIVYTTDDPMCTKNLDEHCIFLSTCGDYWGQWMYQFSHEYCHHLIDGELTGKFCGLKWFEETICELSSLYHINLLCSQWSKSDNRIQNVYAPSLQDYLDNCLTKNPQLIASTHNPGWLSLWLQILSEPKPHRDYYNAIATRMLPLFVETPSLWKIILHIGDSCKWNSLLDLFDHLLEKADHDYILPLRSLEEMMFY